MAYNLMYYGTLRNIDDAEYTVQIYKDGVVDAAKEITLSGESPITVKWECDDIFKPLIQSSCSINVVTDDPLLDLYTGKLNEIMVKISGNFFSWQGYLTPNIYSSDYGVGPNVFTLEFIDVIAQLDNVKFKKTAFFSSFFEYLKNGLDIIDTDGNIDGIYVQNGLDLDLRTVGVLQRNFIDETADEDDGASTYREVLESILKYLGMSMYYYSGTLFIMDLGNLVTNTTTFKVYRRNGTIGSTSLKPQVINLVNSAYSPSDIWVYNDNSTISLGNVYNKVTLIANTNEIDNVLPDLLDDDKLTSIMPANVDYIEMTNYDYISGITRGSMVKAPDSGYTMLNAYFTNSGWTYNPSSLTYYNQGVITHGSVISKDNVLVTAQGCYIQRYADYKTSEGEPSTISWKKCFTFTNYEPYGLEMELYHPNRTPNQYLKLNTTNEFVGMGGYFIISMSYFFQNFYTHANTDCFRITPETYGNCLPYSNIDTSACTWRNDIFLCELKVGDKYYNGTEWTTSASTFTIGHKNNSGDTIFGVTKSIDNTVSYKWGLANAQDGYAVKLPDDAPLFGELSFKLYADARIGGAAQTNTKNGIIMETGDATDFHKYDGDMVWNCSPILSINIDKLEIIYTTTDSVKDIYNLEQYEPDIKYTNVIDDDYITEMEDITLTTNTYNPHAVSYSYVLNKSGDTYTYVREINGKIQEERIIDKYVDYYKRPRLQYRNNLKGKILPYHKIRVRSLDKTFIPLSREFDLAENKTDITMIEV